MKNSCFINLFDIYGKEFKINVSGKEKVKTLEGSIIGFLSLCAILSFLIYQLSQILNNDLVSVIYNETTTNLPVNNFTDVPLLFKVTDILGRRIPPEGLYSLEVYYLNYTQGRDSNNTPIGIIKTLPIKLEQCNRTKHFTGYLDLVEKMNIEEFYCIPTGKHNLTLYGYFGDIVSGFSQMIVYVNKCNNTTQKCLPEETMQSKLGSVYLVFSHLGYQIDNFNYTKPNQLKLYSTALTFSYHLLKRWTINYMPVTYESDYGFFLENKFREFFYLLNSMVCDVDPVPANLINKNPQLTSIHIRNTESTGNHFRSYVKFSSVVASAGGVTKVILIIGQIINYCSTHNFVYEKVSNWIFSFNEEEESKIMKNNSNNINKSFTSNFMIAQDDVNKITRRLKHFNYKNDPENLNSLKNSKENVMKFKSKILQNSTPVSASLKKLAKDKFYEKSKIYIEKKLSLDYIIKQFYFLENYVKNMVDKTIERDLIFDISQKIPHKILDYPIINVIAGADAYPISIKKNLNRNEERVLAEAQSHSMNQLLNS